MSAEGVRNLTYSKSDHLLEILPRIPLLGQVEIIGAREGGLVECYVPTELIDHEEVPVKEEWAESIAKQMRERADREGGTGQKTPIQLGWIDGETKFKIVDGFHRDAALVINNEPHIYSTVEHTDWNTLYDDRIVTAKDHAHVRFSRVVKWMQEVWEYSGLEDQITLEQALLMYRFKTNGEKHGLTPDEVVEAKSWVEAKQHRWEIPAMTIHGYLQTAESVDPELINATREKKSGHVLEAPTQQIIKTFSDFLPNAFDLQNLVWVQAKNYNLKSPQVKAVCDLVRGKSFEEAKLAIAETDIENIAPAYAETKGRQLRRASDPRYKGAAALNNAGNDIGRVTERVRISISKGEEVTPQMTDKLIEARIRVKELTAELGTLAVELTTLIETASLSASERSKFAFCNIPRFGKFTKEEWLSIQPHYRFALSLAHPEITNGDFSSSTELLNEILRIGMLRKESDKQLSKSELIQAIKPIVAKLTRPISKTGNIIEFNRESNKFRITKAGFNHLIEVVAQLKDEFVDSQSSQIGDTSIDPE